MKKSHLVAALAVSLLAAAPAAAQQPVRGQAGLPIALIDVNFIFKNHPRFKGRMEEFKKDVEAAEAQARTDNDALRKLAERLGEFRQGTPDYKALEEDVVRRRFDLAARLELQRREFTQKEAQVYYAIYQEIMQEVQAYCQANGIAMVTKFDHEPIRSERPEDIQRGVNKSVVWYQKELDITPFILERLVGPRGADNRGMAPARPAGVNWK